MTVVMTITTKPRFDAFRGSAAEAVTAANDPMTGLPTQAHLDAHFASCQLGDAPRHGAAGVFYADVDRLRVVNDGFGHRTGDDVVRCVATRLRSLLGPRDFLARVGGDSFVMVCHGLDGEREAILIAERILACVAEPVDTSRGSFNVAVSVGVTLGRDLATASDLLRDSMTAMHEVKERGGRAYAIFDPAVRDRLIREVELQRELRIGISQGELRLYYQPVVSLASGAVVSLEALVRWDHPRRGLLSPAEFVPAAETNGLIVALGEAVLRGACRQIAAWTAHGPAPDWARVAINVSAVQIGDPHFIVLVGEVLRESGIEPRRLAIELTETALMDSLDRADEVIVQLRQMGLRVVLDDFGTGYSSLGYLARFPVDAIKLDRSFISGAAAERSAPIVEAVAGMARALRLELVGEGVETIAQVSRLRAIGCDFAQGFHFARPMPGPDVPAWTESVREQAKGEPPAPAVAGVGRVRVGPSVIGALPALEAVLLAESPALIQTAGKGLYERDLPGWFAAEHSWEPLRAWVAAVASAARTGDLEAALLATRALVAHAEAGGASPLEVTLFLERFGALAATRVRRRQGVRERAQTAGLFDHVRLQPLRAR